MLLYISPEIGEKVYLVFCSKNHGEHGANCDVVIGCIIEQIMIRYDKNKNSIVTEYKCIPKRIIIGKGDLEQYCESFYFTSATCDTGHKDFYHYPVFTTKENCIRYLKGKTINE